MGTKTGAALLALSIVLAGCGQSEPEQTAVESAEPAESSLPQFTVDEAELRTNPLLKAWDTPYGVPPFQVIEDEHYMPAVQQGIIELRAEIAEIIKNPEPATFLNTTVALEKAGETLGRVLDVFGNVTATDTNDTLIGLRAEIYPMVTREYNAIILDENLYARVREVFEQSDQLGLNEVDARLLELQHRNFVRAGAALSPEVRTQVADINAELSKLSNEFGQNLLDATKGFKLRIDDEAGLAGLSEGFAASLYDEDEEAWFVGLNRSQFETFMTESTNRGLRLQLFDAYRTRAATDERNNYALAKQIALLRAQRAELMGYESHAHYQLETRMAKTPAGAEEFLRRVWEPG
ncbi:MAG: M3 family metallopeptidase, partial [Pseudomonadota bacterium]